MTLDVGIARLDCTILASTVAIVLQVFLIALHALPEDVVRRELGVLVKFLTHTCEVLQEI